MAVQDLERIENKIDRVVAGAVAVSDSLGGIMFQNMSEVLEFAKLMSVADVAVPKHLRGNPGACLSIVTQALEWRMSPFSVANKSYSVNDRLAYESQLIHGVVEARAPMKQRLRCAYEGEGDKMACIVTGHFKGETDPVEYRSPEFSKITPKNSPLWKSDPQQQLWYYSVRAFARRYCPDVLLGIYAEDELRDAEIGAEHARDVTPKPDIGSRLKKKEGARGFDAENVSQLPAPAPSQESAKPAETQMELSAGDVETEISAKKRALDNIETQADIDAIIAETTAFLKEAKRTDLLNVFLSAANARSKRIKKREPVAAE